MLIKDATGGSTGSRSARDEHIGQCAMMISLEHIIPLWIQKLSPTTMSIPGQGQGPPHSSNNSLLSTHTNNSGYTLTKQQLQQHHVPILLPIQPPRKCTLLLSINIYKHLLYLYICIYLYQYRSITIS